MTWFPFVFVMISESCSVVGQLLLKHAMGGKASNRRQFILTMTAAITVMAIGFFLWTGLMSKFDLSYLYPFDGLNRIVLVIAASVFLKEKMTLNLWVGVLLICGGVFLVSAS